MRPAAAALVVVILSGALSACVDAGPSGPAAVPLTGPATPSPSGPATASPSGPAQVARLVTEREANLHLWVSNQSFADDPVAITINIDGHRVVARPFAVEGQHNWVLFPIAATPGRHELIAVSGTEIEMRQTFTLPESGRRYAVVDYWNYPDDGGRRFTWLIMPAPIRFA
jgi:hypothetical protein